MAEISLIIPVFNTEKYLKKCLNSLLNQTFGDFEIIAVDDASSDNSFSLLKEFSLIDKRIKIFQTPNLKAAGARNFGLTKASGKYVQFLDSDDYFESSMLEELYSRAIKFDADITVCSSRKVDDKGNIVETQNPNSPLKLDKVPLEKVFSAQDFKDDFFSLLVPIPWNKLFKRSFLEKNNITFPLLNIAEDVPFCYLAMAKAKKIVAFNLELINYRFNRPNSHATYRSKYVLDIIKAYLILKERLGLTPALIETFKNHFRWETTFCSNEEYSSFLDELKKLPEWEIFKSALKPSYLTPQFLNDFIGDKKVVLWGASFFIKKLLKGEKNENILGIIDSNAALWDKDFEGYRVYPPTKLEELNPDKIIMTIYSNHEELYPKFKERFRDKLADNIFNLKSFYEITSELFRQNLEELNEKYKNKKVLLYGAGLYLDSILNNYKLNLDIIGLSDRKFSETGSYRGYRTYPPDKINELNFDIMLVTTQNFQIIKNSFNDLDKEIIHIAPSVDKKAQFVQKNYEKVLKNLKAKEKIKAGFVVNQIEKWQYETLLEEFKKDSRFETTILITPKTSLGDKGGVQNELFEFFKNKNTKVEFGYKNGYIDINEFQFDLVFYEQPWELDTNQNPFCASKNSLTFYCPYAISEATSVFYQTEEFFKLLFRHFLVDNSAKEQYLTYCPNLSNLRVTGHPKLDSIISAPLKKKNKKTIIYAPHHSIHPMSLRWATFLWSKDIVLELALKYQEFNWVIKPHPGLVDMFIKNNSMTKEDFDIFFSKWQEVGSIVEGGDYFELFLESDLMITDCGSFIVEYLPTKNPVIHLQSENPKPHSTLNRKILKTYYNATNKEELKRLFEVLMIENNDNMKQERLSLLKKLDFGSASKKIVQEIKSLII